MSNRWVTLFSFILLVEILALSSWYYIKSTYRLERRIVERQKLLPREEIKNFDHKLVFVGDSMTEYLGNMEELNYFLKKYYPDKNILLLNYGYSSTNLLSVPDRLEKDSTHSGRIYQAVNNIDFDYIFLESFGNNPMSGDTTKERLSIQNQTLDKIISSITKIHSKSKIIFIATIAPDRKNFAKNIIEMSAEDRLKWADTRSELIKNHIKYAKDHNFPVIDIYNASLTPNGIANSKFISRVDHIHPSVVGIYFIDDLIAQFISKNNLLKDNSLKRY